MIVLSDDVASCGSPAVGVMDLRRMCLAGMRECGGNRDAAGVGRWELLLAMSEKLLVLEMVVGELEGERGVR